MMKATLLLAVTLVAAPAAAQRAPGAMIDQMVAADANKDGIVTRGELLNSRAANFARFDRNGDGALADNDIPFFLKRTSLGEQFSAMRGQFDTNRDGKVSRDEFVNGPTPVFNAADTNRDNRLTADEIDAAKAQAKR
jgi:Ca2+-binding EF-hand superfamily protein